MRHLDIKTHLLTGWMCYFCDITKALHINHLSEWFLALGHPFSLLLPRCHSLKAHAITCTGDWAPPSPHPLWISWMETRLHLTHFWFSFFFFPVPLFYSSALLLSVLCVIISPTPLLCHQLALLVSKSWSHCACIALFSVFLITHMYACTVVAFHKHIHQTYIVHAYLHCYYQPLTSPGSLL